MNKFEKYSKWIMALVFAIILIAVYKTFDNFNKIIDAIAAVWNALAPFVIGFVVAYLFNMPCKKIAAKMSKSKYKFFNKYSKALSIISVYAVAVLILLIVIRLVVPALYKNLADLYVNVPKYFDQTMSAIVKWQTEHNVTLFEVDKLTATNTFNSIIDKIDLSQFSKYAQGVVKLTSGVINVLIGVIASVYMLIEKENIIAGGKKLVRLIFKEETAEKVITDAAKINDIFSKYIFCLLLDAAIVMVIVSVVLSLLGVKYALVLGVVMGVCNLIPYFGAIVSSISAVLITIVTGGWVKAVWTAVALAIIQQLDGNYISPKIMGEVLDISPLWIIFAVTLGGGLFGIGGMILSVPIFMIIKMIIEEILKNIEERKANKTDE